MSDEGSTEITESEGGGMEVVVVVSWAHDEKNDGGMVRRHNRRMHSIEKVNKGRSEHDARS